MKLADNPPKVIDEVITEVRAIKRAISERHGNDIDRLLAALISKSAPPESRQNKSRMATAPRPSVAKQSLKNGGGAIALAFCGRK